jgi:hypothetical protein
MLLKRQRLVFIDQMKLGILSKNLMQFKKIWNQLFSVNFILKAILVDLLLC